MYLPNFGVPIVLQVPKAGEAPQHMSETLRVLREGRDAFVAAQGHGGSSVPSTPKGGS